MFDNQPYRQNVDQLLDRISGGFIPQMDLKKISVCKPDPSGTVADYLVPPTRIHEANSGIAPPDQQEREAL